MEDNKQVKRQKKVEEILNEIESGINRYRDLNPRIKRTIERIESTKEKDASLEAEGSNSSPEKRPILDRLISINNLLANSNNNFESNISELEDLI